MKRTNKKISRVFALVLLLALASAPQFTLLRPAHAQDPNGISYPTLLRDLGIDSEARQISSLVETHVTFFKRAADHRKKGGLTAREARELQSESDQRKGDLSTLQRQFESLINKLKQGNHWDETFDAQVLASLKSASARSVLTQAGGARKVFQAAAGEVNLLRQEIDDEVREVSSNQTGGQRSRGDRAFAAHGKPLAGKAGCNVLVGAYVTALLAGAGNVACAIAKRYNDKGCPPKLDCN